MLCSVAPARRPAPRTADFSRLGGTRFGSDRVGTVFRDTRRLKSAVPRFCRSGGLACRWESTAELPRRATGVCLRSCALLTLRVDPGQGPDIDVMVACAGPLATRNREPGQARKGAAAAVEACAGVWLASAAAPVRSGRASGRRRPCREHRLGGRRSCARGRAVKAGCVTRWPPARPARPARPGTGGRACPIMSSVRAVFSAFRSITHCLTNRF